MLLFRTSTLKGCFKPRHITKQDVFLSKNADASAVLKHSNAVLEHAFAVLEQTNAVLELANAV